MEKQRYVAVIGKFPNRWEVWRGSMLMGMFYSREVAEETAAMWNNKAGFNEGKEK